MNKCLRFLLSFVLLMATIGVSRSSEQPPNFVIIMTDDQDIVLNGLTPMKKTLDLLADQGATFRNAFTTSPICCPSRSSFLSGMLAHNHRTTNNSLNGGCYSAFWQQLEAYTFPAILKDNGYHTFYAGKYLNQYYCTDVPDGYDQFYGLQGNSKYYNYTLNENGALRQYADEYLTDVLLQRSLAFIDDQTNSTENETPFLMIIAPPAPHHPFTSADQYKNAFQDIKAPRTNNFNVQNQDKHWLLTMPPSELPENIIDSIDEFYHKRWQTLLSVDDLVEGVVKFLMEKGFLDNTYIIFTSDNGYHLGQFAQAYDKRQPYDTDIRVPFIIRGPNIPKKIVINDLVALIDTAPTVLELANIPNEHKFFDGISFTESLHSNHNNEINVNKKQMKRTKLLIEYWGEGNEETYNPDCPWAKTDMLNQCNVDAACQCEDSWNNTYSCIREISPGTDYLYCMFKDHQNYIEGYNLLEDPYQLKNIGYTEIPSIRAQYQLLLTKMVDCKGSSCVI